MKKPMICLGLVSVLFGCGGSAPDEFALDSDGPRISITPNMEKQSGDTEIAIAEAARAATTSLQRLAQLQQALLSVPQALQLLTQTSNHMS